MKQNFWIILSIRKTVLDLIYMRIYLEYSIVSSWYSGKVMFLSDK